MIYDYEMLPGLLTWWGAPEESTTVFPVGGLLQDYPWPMPQPQPGPSGPMVERVSHGGSYGVSPGSAYGGPTTQLGVPLPRRGRVG